MTCGGFLIRKSNVCLHYFTPKHYSSSPIHVGKITIYTANMCNHFGIFNVFQTFAKMFFPSIKYLSMFWDKHLSNVWRTIKVQSLKHPGLPNIVANIWYKFAVYKNGKFKLLFLYPWKWQDNYIPHRFWLDK